MTFTELIIQTVVTFVAASIGAVFGAFLARRTERFKHLQELKSTAYADFLRGLAKAAGPQDLSTDEVEVRIMVADSRARIAIYGGRDVVSALSKFISLGTQTHTPEGMQAFANLCALMRAETGREHVAIEDITRILFS